MDNYYSQNLSAKRLQKCYQIAPARIKQYLKAESGYIISLLKKTDEIIELGCGYGRLVKEFCPLAKTVTGIDNSSESLAIAKEYLKDFDNFCLHRMDAAHLGFPDNSFDLTICIQNGISAFKVEPSELIAETVRVTRPGGLAVFSSYSDKFWSDRLNWFELQAQAELLGAIDYDLTRDGVIICRDAFKATTFSPGQFRKLISDLNLDAEIFEIDNSSIFCKIKVQ